MRAVFLDAGSVDAGDLDYSALRAACSALEIFPSTGPEQVAERIAGAQVVITNKVALDGQLLRAVPSLQLIALTATGSNNIDMAVAGERGITVCNLRAYATASVVQHVFAMMLAFKTRWQEYHRLVTSGAWSRAEHFCLLDYPIDELSGARLGIVGYGELGQGVAAVARAFGMQVLVAERAEVQTPRRGRMAFDEVLAQADVLTLHCPLTPQTRHLMNSETLAKLPAHALLINTARGAVVEPVALAQALRAGTLAGAAMDVLDPEPPPPEHPLLADDIPNLWLTPHTAWASRQSRQRALDQTAANVQAFLAGAPRNVVRL